VFLDQVCIALAVAGGIAFASPTALASPALSGVGVPAAPANLEATIDHAIKQRMQRANIVGLGAAIIVNKKLVWTRGYGFADKERALPFKPDTIMNIGSISKTITGVALMRAVEDGKLLLDENINKYLPFEVVNPSFPNDPITLRHLATHTSSIRDRGQVYAGACHFGRDSPEPLAEFLRDYFALSGKNCHVPDDCMDVCRRSFAILHCIAQRRRV
jgi:CubicO group peptidase (beta-lactamase class C family)